MQDVILLDIAINDIPMISNLLSTHHLKGKAFETEHGGFLLMYGGEYERPYGAIITRPLAADLQR